MDASRVLLVWFPTYGRGTRTHASQRRGTRRMDYVVIGRSAPLSLKPSPNLHLDPDGAQLQPRCGRIRLPVGLSAAAIREAICQLAILELSGEVSASNPPGYPQDIHSYPPGYPLHVLSAASRDHHVTLSRDTLHKDSGSIAGGYRGGYSCSCGQPAKISRRIAGGYGVRMFW